MSTYLLLLLVVLVAGLIDVGYWFALRAFYRWQWRRGDLSISEFFEGLQKAPAWLTRSTR